MNDRVETGPAQTAAEPSPWNVPNALTVLRILMVPVFLVLLLQDGGENLTARWWALIVFLLAMLTDKIDGDLARKYNLITNFGKLADPIADKSLMAAAFIGLAITGELYWWVPVVILVREFGITILRFFMVRIAVMPASRGGKIKTVLQTVAVGLFLLAYPLGHVVPHWLYLGLIGFAWFVLVLAIIVTLVTGIDYCLQASKLAKAAHAADDADTSASTSAEVAAEDPSSAEVAPAVDPDVDDTAVAGSDDAGSADATGDTADGTEGTTPGPKH